MLTHEALKKEKKSVLEYDSSYSTITQNFAQMVNTKDDDLVLSWVFAKH